MRDERSRARVSAAVGLPILLALAGCAPSEREASPPPEPSPATKQAPGDQTVWFIDNLQSIGGRPTSILGSPRVVDSPRGKAVEFDGEEDGLIVDAHPLAGADEFTAEVIFRPDPGGEPEQRFLHLQEGESKDRLLFEIRVTDDGRWFLDTYIKSGGEGYTLFARKFEHPLGEWYHAAIVVSDGVMRHFVNGVLEMSRSIALAPQKPGRTSIGVRINEVSWFKGAIREARFTPRALERSEFSF